MALSTVTYDMGLQEAIETRRSMRRYQPDPVPQEDVAEVLRLSSLAPSAWNLQPWRFIVVQDPQLKAQLSEIAYNQPQLVTAPVVIVLYSDMQATLANLDEVMPRTMPAAKRESYKQGILNAFASMGVAEQESWGAGQSYIALGFLMLAARSLGYHTSPMLGFDSDKAKELLNLPPHVVIPALVPIGISDDEGYPHERHELERIVTFR